MPAPDLSSLLTDQRPTATWALALLHALARDESAGRRPPRLTEAHLATWTRFRGRLRSADLAALVFEDAAVLHPVPFAPDAINPNPIDPANPDPPLRLDRLPNALIEDWLANLPNLDLATPAPDYVAAQARLLGPPTRLARSELHIVKAHQKVLELPGTGGQLAHHLVVTHSDLTLQDNFVIACETWQELALAGIVALDCGAPHTDFVVRASVDDLRDPAFQIRHRTFDFVIGLHPDKGGLFRIEDQLAIWFPTAKILLVYTMPARFVPIGEPAHDAERQAIRSLVEGLPENYTVYGNPWLVERNGGIFELDALVVAPHAVFIVEIKAYRGRIDGTDHDWYVPNPIPSPLKLNRLTAQIFKAQLKRQNWQAGQIWVEGLIYASLATDIAVAGPASRDRIHTRKTILSALQDASLVERLSGRRQLSPTASAEKDILQLLTGVKTGPRPVRHIREYEILAPLDHQETFNEFLGKNGISGAERVLRVYSVPALAPDTQRERIEKRARWEAQVLGRLGRIEGILAADPPFSDEAGIVLPLEYFKGITLPTWLSKYGPDSRDKKKAANLLARTELWIRLTEAIDEAHRQGVVHRLLRPEVVLVEDSPDPRQIRVTGFDLAKQVALDKSISILTSVGDERLTYAAPEVVNSFSSAVPASDQFSLGAILALMLTGKPLFESTRQLMAERRLMRRVRDMAQRIPLSLDEAVTRMVALRPQDRFPTLGAAMGAVFDARDPEPRLPGFAPQAPVPLDPDNLQKGTRIEPDYEVLERLGQGGMAVVYAARHLVSGRTRALKIARTDNAAEDALREEYKALEKLDHPNVVRQIDLTKMVAGRLTLVMERVGGQNLRQWLAEHPAPDAAIQRRLSEDLLAGLDYLENRGVTHKDLKPDNLLVSDGHLVIIDFSLAGIPEDAVYAGTALYRDPTTIRWTHGTDRFAAALCLFELYPGRHAFEGRVPEPGEAPAVREDDIHPAGLAAFFLKALDPVPEKRFPSARAMRDAFLVALGEDPTPTSPAPAPEQADATTSLRCLGLSSRALNALARCQVHTVGDLLVLSPSQVRAIHAIGTRAAEDVIALQGTLQARGLVAPDGSPSAADPPMVPALVGSPEPVHKLALPGSLRMALEAARLPTVGSVAALSADRLRAVPGIGRTRSAQVVTALQAFQERTPASAEAAGTLDHIWKLATRPLSEPQRAAVERSVGLVGEPEPQAIIAQVLGKSQPQVSNDLTAGLAALDLSMLSDVTTALENVLDGFGGIARLDHLADRLQEAWPAEFVSAEGLVRLLLRITPGHAHLVEVEGAEAPLVARPVFDRETLRAFAAEVMRIAAQWPPVEPEAARRTLAGLLPHFDGDPLGLGVQVCEDVDLAASGHLFVGPLSPRQSIGFVLEQTRDPLPLEEIERRVRRIFGPETPYPHAHHLLELLRELDCRVQGDTVIPGAAGSVLAGPALRPDELPAALGAARSPEEVVRDMLRDAARSRGFRMLVTPPEKHPEIGRSVAAALGGTWVSFEDAFFAQHGAQMPALERAERFVAQREALREAAEQTLFDLLEQHAAPGRSIVLGDTALFGLCEALDLPRLLYDETLSGSRGFWVLVVPGVIHKQQPRFNEGPAMWHLDGATVPLMNPLPG